MRINYTRALLQLFLILSVSCRESLMDDPIPMEAEIPTVDSMRTLASLIDEVKATYSLMPEAAWSVAPDSSVIALYTDPVTRYTHGILGDAIEAGRLVVIQDQQVFDWLLLETYVFEDIRPRLVDIDGDGQLEVVTIRTQVSNGAGIAVYKVNGNVLSEIAFVEAIGRSSRWLNIAMLDDWDNDQVVELAWIETPHIGGTLKVAKYQPGKIDPLDALGLYSNHAIGDRNLCLSVLLDQNGQKVLYVPTQNRNKIVGFTLESNQLNIIAEINQSVDFSIPLKDQYGFPGMTLDTLNCINPN